MTAPIVYRWDDTGAPVARGELESLIQILSACLVTGYGSKSAAGWTKPYDDGLDTRAIFRNDATSGTGMYFYVDATNNNYVKSFYVQGYESCTGLDTRSFPISGDSMPEMIMSSVNSAAARCWILIADARCFYLFVWRGSDGTSTLANNDYDSAHLFFGDILSSFSTDPYACAFIHGSHYNYPGYMPDCVDAGLGSDIQHYIARNRNGDNAATAIGKTFGGGPGALTSGAAGPARSDGLLYFSQPSLTDGASNTHRGFLPGFHHLGNDNITAADFSNLEQISEGGKTLLVLLTQRYSNNATVAIDIGTGFRP